MPPTQPFIISGNITNPFSSTENKVKVTIFNLRTEESADYITESDGNYIVDLSNFPFTKAYANNDIILIRAAKEGIHFKFVENRRILKTVDGFIEQNLTLSIGFPRQPKDLDNKQIELAEHDPIENAKRIATLDPLNKYNSSEASRIGDIRYASFVDKDGNWYIREHNFSDRAAETHRYIKGDKDLSISWDKKTTLDYKRFEEVF